LRLEHLWWQLSCGKIEYLEGGYSIEVPMTLHLAQGNPMPDFALYELTDQKGKQLLLIYLGSAPDTRFELTPKLRKVS
jgi:hypothetical protein